MFNSANSESGLLQKYLLALSKEDSDGKTWTKSVILEKKVGKD